MKKILLLFCVILLNLNDTVLAYEPIQGEVVATVYDSDIITYIDNMYIPSYNIGGETFIFVDDLAQFGYSIEKEQGEERLSITLKQTEPPSIPPFEKPAHRTRKERPIGKIKSTNTTVEINDMYVFQDAVYSFHGKIGIVVERIATPGMELLSSAEMYSLQAIGYSNYLFSYVWEENDKSLNIKTLHKGAMIPTNLGSFPVDYISFAWENKYYGNCFLTEKKHSFEEPVSDWSSEKHLKVIITENDNGYNRYYNLSEFLEYFNQDYVLKNGCVTMQPSAQKNTYQLHDSENNVKHKLANWVHIELKGENNVTADAIVQYGEVYILASDIEKLTGIQYDYDAVQQISYFEI